jgi:hypothetical protein
MRLKPIPQVISSGSTLHEIIPSNPSFGVTPERTTYPQNQPTYTAKICTNASHKYRSANTMAYQYEHCETAIKHDIEQMPRVSFLWPIEPVIQQEPSQDGQSDDHKYLGGSVALRKQ